ncbi:MAG: alpha/beta hydrolase [Alphaproteobacteria bacterium]|nr:alpha/beta hydrolase [Alphaproteobacteria bacterium]
MPYLEVTPTVKIAYEVLGDGPSFAEALAGKPPIVLVHGFASNRFMNWRAPGWYDTLVKAGRQVIALDVRGHGESDKPHDIEAYDEGELAGDVVRLLDALGHEQADVMGYSMGGFITLRLLHDQPSRVRRAVIAGVGENYYGRGRLESEAIAAAMRVRDAADVVGAVPKTFRVFAEQGKNDLEALALCMTRRRHSFSADEMRGLDVPTLIVLGEADTVTGPADALAEALPGTRVVIVPKRDHMSTVGDKTYKAEVLAFLNEA